MNRRELVCVLSWSNGSKAFTVSGTRWGGQTSAFTATIPFASVAHITVTSADGDDPQEHLVAVEAGATTFWFKFPSQDEANGLAGIIANYITG